MDTSRHLVHDNAFDVYERASYGRGCEIQPIADDKHKQCSFWEWEKNFVSLVILVAFLNLIFVFAFSMLFGIRFTRKTAFVGH